ncbi:MAG TPA: V4R domain-containing protein [Nitrososphaerales archaeon]|nr:V4R domain-containing protein [Nitrososphaerales archaeon]
MAPPDLMDGRNKDVMVYRFNPKGKHFLVSLHLENKPGALGNLANLLAIRGMNILEGFFGGMSYGEKANVSFFLESTNQQIDEGWIKDFLATSVYVSDVEVKSSVEGFLTDSLNFPITWNNGDRAVLMRVEGLRVMLDSVKATEPGVGEEAIYLQGFSYGKAAWENLMGVHHPKTREGLAEMLKIYIATGWGKIDLIDVNTQHNHAQVKMDEAFESTGLNTGKAECYFIGGHLAGMMSAYFGAEVKTVETKCRSKGDPHCEFQISP